jgi:WD40 repeat protein
MFILPLLPVSLKDDEEEKLDSPDTALQPYKPAIEGERVKINTIAISTENVRNIQEISRLGYGRPEDIAVSKKHAFAVASSAGVFIYDSAAGKLVNWIDPGEWSTSVCFSSSGDLLAIGLSSGDIQIWNWQEDTLLSTLEKHKGKVSRVLFSSNDRFVYSASFDQDIIVWDLIAQKPLRIIRAHSTPIREIVVSSDGRYLASAASDQVIRLWDVSSGARLHEFSFPGRVEALAISPDDEYIAVGGESGFIRQWNIKTKQLRTDPIPVKARIFDIKYLSTNTLFAGIEGARHQTYSPQQLKYPGISLDFTAKPVASSLMRIFGPQFEFNTIFATFGDTSNVISAEWNGSLFRNKQVLWEPTYDIPDQLSFSPNSAFLATSGRRDIVKIWDIQASKLLYLDNSKLPSGNNISHDSAKVILIQPRPEGVSNVSEKYYLLDAKSKTRINLSDTLNSGSVSFTMDDSLLASANLSASNVWDVNTGYEVFFETRRDSNCWITFSANNDAIIQVNSSAGTFLEWDERIKNICLKSFGQSLSVVSENLELMAYRTTAGNLEIFSPNENRILWKYTPVEPISAIAISPDGNIISIGTLSGKLLFMSAEDGELLFEKTGNYGALMNIKFSSQGNILATIGTDGTARLFSISHQP